MWLHQANKAGIYRVHRMMLTGLYKYTHCIVANTSLYTNPSQFCLFPEKIGKISIFLCFNYIYYSIKDMKTGMLSHTVYVAYVLCSGRYRSILKSILVTSGGELVDGLKAFVEAGKQCHNLMIVITSAKGFIFHGH